jgi:type I restriction enzyme S subunit
MSFPRYFEYKGSGVEWLGEVPGHWAIMPLKRLATLITGMTPPTTDEENYSDEETYHWIRPEDISESGQFTYGSKFISNKGWTQARQLLPNSVLICCIGTIGKIGFTEIATSTNQQITAAIFTDNPRYFYYFLCAARAELEVTSTGNVVRILNTERLGGIKFALPPKAEQQAIAAFLDSETSKIDALIAEQRRLVELLAEKRQAVISHAVTKGLNPNAAMKDSGIAWLGEVPAHWEVKPIKAVSTCNDEVLAESTPSDYEIEYVEISGVDSSRGITQTTVIPFGNAPSRARRRVTNGDILVSTVRTYLRAIAPVNNPPINMIASTGFAVIRPRYVEPCFLSFIFQAEYLIAQIIAHSVGVSYPAINASDLMHLNIPIPSREEQQAIAAFLDSETTKFNVLTLEAIRAIELLQERRSTLISAAVTGKIDVREALNKEWDTA